MSLGLVSNGCCMRPYLFCSLDSFIKLSTKRESACWMLIYFRTFLCMTIFDVGEKLVSLSHPQLWPYGSAHHISSIRVWRRTLNCMLYSYQCLQIVHWLFNLCIKLVRGIQSIQIIHNIYESKWVLQITVKEH